MFAALLSLGQQKKAECGGVGGAGQASIFGGKGLLRTLVVAIVVPVSRHSRKRLLPGRRETFVDLFCLQLRSRPFVGNDDAETARGRGYEMIAILREIVPGARISAGDGEIKHPGGIDMPRKGALDISRAAKVFGFRPRYDLRAGLEAYVRGERRLIERRRP